MRSCMCLCVNVVIASALVLVYVNLVANGHFHLCIWYEEIVDTPTSFIAVLSVLVVA